jgi:hypothetical protein
MSAVWLAPRSPRQSGRRGSPFGAQCTELAVRGDVRAAAKSPERTVGVALAGRGEARWVLVLAAAELDGFDDEQDHGDEEVAAEGEHRDFAAG